jgi:citrate synthase
MSASLQTLAEIGTVDTHSRGVAPRQGQEQPLSAQRFRPPALQELQPRAKVLRRRCYEVLDTLGQIDDPLLELAMEMERVVLADDCFIERKLYPNVDFYSGIIFRALGLPPAMFTPVFAGARTVGWVAHWNEMIADQETRLFRPRQLYAGPAKRAVVPIAERATHEALLG